MGSQVKIDWKSFNAGPSAIEALFAGAIDMTYVGPNPAINGYVRSNGQALRIVAGATSGGAALVVRNDSGIQKAQDFHGFPARALVPGWIGAASCKWLTEIKVLEKEFEGNFMKPGYRLPNQPVAPGGSVNPDDTHPVTALNVKSVIATPNDGATVRGRVVQIHEESRTTAGAITGFGDRCPLTVQKQAVRS